MIETNKKIANAVAKLRRQHLPPPLSSTSLSQNSSINEWTLLQVRNSIMMRLGKGSSIITALQ